jgi:predicted nuclease of predicted toxin-antitoxin system
VKIKLDENIPVSVVQVLASHGHDVHSVWDEGLVGRKDQEILSWVFGTQDVESWNSCLVIVSETKIRIRRS